MPIIIITYLIASIVAGIGEGLRIKDVSKYSTAWHWLQLFERVLIFTAGYLTASVTGILQISVLLLVFAVVFFIVYDGCINLILGRNFFYVSKTSTAFTEKFAQWYVKIPLIIILFLLNAFLGKKYGKSGK